MDRTGWESLCRLSSCLLSAETPAERPLCTVDMLAEYTTGLLCLTGGCRGILQHHADQSEEEKAAALLGTVSDLFPGRLYLELNQQGQCSAQAAQWYARLAARLNS
jgi:DNA polymerase III subunit alpha